jgi:hypothetical protein
MASDSMKTANGLHTIGVARGIEDTNMVVVILRTDDVAKAKAFVTSPEIKTAMDSATVTGPPTFEFIDVVRNDDSEIPQMERLMVKHHVKDFASWLKVYDKEGKDTRAGFGWMDRALGRGIDDSNMVYVSSRSPTWQSNGTWQIRRTEETDGEAGVDSAPEMFAYKFDIYSEK